MRLVDSSLWIEFLTRGALAGVAEANLREPGDVLVPTMVMLEVYKWMYREHGEDLADRVAARMMLSQIDPMDAVVAIHAARLCRVNGLATADATILAHAQIRGVELVTCDRHFEGIPGVVFYAKAPVGTVGG